MKKIMIIPIFIFILVNIYLKEITANSFETYEDLDTLNFQEKLPYIKLENIKRICSYEYCDYLVGENLDNALASFTNRYIKSNKNDKEDNLIKKEGIKITKVILEN